MYTCPFSTVAQQEFCAYRGFLFNESKAPAKRASAELRRASSEPKLTKRTNHLEVKINVSLELYVKVTRSSHGLSEGVQVIK